MIVLTNKRIDIEKKFFNNIFKILSIVAIILIIKKESIFFFLLVQV